MTGGALSGSALQRRLPRHGWLGLGLVAVFWPLNWLLAGLRTHWGFFPLWLGYCLAVDGINVYRSGTSLLTRDRRLYLTLFLISIPIWWIFEAVNWRTQNWRYLGREFFGDLEFALLASLSFSTVVPAVLGTAELFAGFDWVRRFRRLPAIHVGDRGLRLLFGCGLAMVLLMMAWPRLFFPFIWLFAYFLLDPLNVWLGHRNLLDFFRRGDWRPALALGLGVLVCAFFWEMWNYLSYPKWVYDVPFFGFWHVFEMPLPGYLGYLPFSLEIFAMVHLVLGLLGRPDTEYVLSGLGLEAASPDR